MDVPVLLIHFNRPDITQRQIDSLDGVKPRRVWILCDGSRNEQEDKLVSSVRSKLDNLPWECEVHRKYRDKNLGVYRNISDGIGWFLDEADEGIILEDDCIPDPSFFEYCRQSLERYRNCRKIVSISGYTNMPEDRFPDDFSYGYSHYFSCWGWATWKRSWKLLDADLEGFKNKSEWRNIERFILGGFRQRMYWRMIMRRLSSGKIDSWAYRMQLGFWRRRGLTVVPRRNLISNVGFGDDATNTTDLKSFNVESRTMESSMKHPTYIAVRQAIDKWIEDHTHSKSFLVRIRWIWNKFL